MLLMGYSVVMNDLGSHFSEVYFFRMLYLYRLLFAYFWSSIELYSVLS